MHDIKFMVKIIYQWNACYVFDRAYFDLSRIYAIEQAGAFFIIREKFHPYYQITDGEDLLEGDDIILRDQIVRFTGKRNGKNYPIPLRHIIYFAPGFGRTFTYYTNNFYLKAKDTENAVRIQVHLAIITYCLVAIKEHYLKLGRLIDEVMRILGNSLLVKDPIQEFLAPTDKTSNDDNDYQLHLELKFDSHFFNRQQ
jgi:hypothetical protein